MHQKGTIARAALAASCFKTGHGACRPLRTHWIPLLLFQPTSISVGSPWMRLTEYASGRYLPMRDLTPYELIAKRRQVLNHTYC